MEGSGIPSVVLLVMTTILGQRIPYLSLLLEVNGPVDQDKARPLMTQNMIEPYYSSASDCLGPKY